MAEVKFQSTFNLRKLPSNNNQIDTITTTTTAKRVYKDRERTILQQCIEPNLKEKEKNRKKNKKLLLLSMFNG
jgi:hypothetical protein